MSANDNSGVGVLPKSLLYKNLSKQATRHISETVSKHILGKQFEKGMRSSIVNTSDRNVDDQRSCSSLLLYKIDL